MILGTPKKKAGKFAFNKQKAVSNLRCPTNETEEKKTLLKNCGGEGEAWSKKEAEGNINGDEKLEKGNAGKSENQK